MAGYFPPSGPSSAGPPFAGLWRQGNVLVMHKLAPLPDICLKSNQPAMRRLKRSLSWHHPAVFLIILVHILIYIVVALVVRKTAKIHIPLTEEWFAIRRRRMILSWSMILLSVVMFGAAVSVVDQQAWAPWILIIAIFLGLGAAIYGLLACRLVWPKRMTDEYIWLKGVHSDYLARLEVWPYNV
jgi:H+/Cl- antiporter ClcA